MQCVPIRELKDTTNISQLCHASSEPITITKNGYEDMVIMSAEVYERIRLYSVYEKLMEAERDVESGAVNDAFNSVAALRGKYGL